MASQASSFLVRVRDLPDGGYQASVRQLCGQRVEDMSSIGPISTAVGQTELAAMTRALAEVRLDVVHEVRHVA